MKFSAIKLCALVGLASLILIGFRSHALPVTIVTPNNKVIIYPTVTESIDQLNQNGITKVKNYGSYWLVEATDAQVDELTKMYGARAVKESRLNRIELDVASFDTTAGDPSVPKDLQQVDGPGKRLRLVQFRGPVTPKWLQLVKSAGNVQIISYLPHNAYLVQLDASAEANLRDMEEPSGPIQWIGAYHPYYKIKKGLVNADSEAASSLVDVRVIMVRDCVEDGTLDEIRKFGLVQESYDILRQKTVQMTVPASTITAIAKLDDVIWIEKNVPKRLHDENDDLILASQTNGLPSHSPSGITSTFTNYLDFLTNTVGGGVASFTNQAAYPIVDICDSGFDNGTMFPQHPSFYEFGDPGGNPSFPFPLSVIARRTRVAYTQPLADPYYFVESVDVVAGSGDLGCPRLNINFNAAEDFQGPQGHGTMVASILAGFDTNANPAIFSVNIISSLSSNPVGCTGTNCIITTNLASVSICTPHRDQPADDCTVPGTFQLGLGVSPFGRFGSTRVFSQSAHIVNNAPVYDSDFFCLTAAAASLGKIIANAYGNGARIQNNSWSDALDVTGNNGGAYNDESAVYDVGVRDSLLVGTSNNVPGPFPLNQEMIAVFSGNGAGSSEGSGGFADLRIAAPATAKNVITVGATENARLDGSGCEFLEADQDNTFDVARFSNFGPTLDGRFKPEIVAPGASVFGAVKTWTLVVNARGELDKITRWKESIDPTTFLPDPTTIYLDPWYTCDSGSSFAAPAVSGGIQLLWWYFQHRLTNEVGQALLQPSPAMAKAYLCNSARYLPITDSNGDMDTLPSIAQGMGEMDLLRMFDGVPRLIRDESTPRAISVPFIATNPAPQQTYFTQSGQSYEASGQIANSNLQFRVTLAWADAAGLPGAQQELVNDLDLSVTVGGVTYKGNVFSQDRSIPGGSFDSVNNMESVFLPAGQTGTWSVVVRAQNIAGDGVPNVGGDLDQDFALIVYNAATNTLSDIPNLAINNACQTAIDITQFPFSFTNFLTKAVYRNVHPSPSIARGGIDEFFKIQKPTPGTIFTVNTFGSKFDTVLSVWSVQVIPQTVFVRGNCGALTEVAANNDAGGSLQSQLTFTADGSNDYYIVVEPHNDGPGSNMVLNVQATKPPITITPTSLTFGNQIVGTTSAGQTITYQNGTTISVDISTVSITGPNALDFVFLSQTCEGNLLPQGTNCTTIVAFAPTAVGLRQANLVFTDDATGSPRSIPLSGIGTPAAPLVCLSSSASLTFGSQLIGTTSVVQSVTITNCGSSDLNISSVVLSGSSSGDFSVTNTCTGGPVSAGGTCTLNVTFNPTALGNRQASVIITHDAVGSPITLTVQGVGTALAPALCFPISSVSFDSVGVGSTGSVKSITITNCGTAALVISNVSITGANTGDFIVVTNMCGTVAAGATCQVNLQFAPTAGGSRSANLSISNNVSAAPQLLALIGSGALSQPDAAIGKNTKLKKMVGFGTNDTTGVGQELVQKVSRGAKKGKKYYVAVRNIGSGNDRFLVQSQCLGSCVGFTVNYFIGAKPSESVDVTAAVGAGTFGTSTMGPGAVTSDTTMIRVEVFADKVHVGKGTTGIFTLTFSSASDPTKQDTVRITTIAK